MYVIHQIIVACNVSIEKKINDVSLLSYSCTVLYIAVSVCLA